MITQEQWFRIFIDGLGLRSEDNAEKIKNYASYAMDMSVDPRVTDWREIPVGWEMRLHNTLDLMKRFENSNSRFLMIVRNSRGIIDNEYVGCFPKCNTYIEFTGNSISLQSSLGELKSWVINNI